MALSGIEKLHKVSSRRRRRRLVLFLFSTVLIVIITVILLNIFFNIKYISIENNSKYDSLVLLDNPEIKIGSGLLSVNTKKLEKNMPVEYPYIDKITVDIGLPNHIDIKVEAAYVEVMLEKEDKYIFIDKNLKVLQESFEPANNVMLVKGLDLTEYKIGYIIDDKINIEIDLIRKILNELKQSNINGSIMSMDFTKKHNISFVINNVVEVQIGNTDDLDKKFEQLANILQRNPGDESAVINISNYKMGRYRKLE